MAHPNVQQLLASIWYEGLPGFRQMNMILQVIIITIIAIIIITIIIIIIATIIITIIIIIITMRLREVCVGGDMVSFLRRELQRLRGKEEEKIVLRKRLEEI